MNTIIQIILPITLVVLAGVLAGRVGFFDKTAAATLTRFVFHVPLPLLLFHSLATVVLPEQIEWQFMLSYYLIALLIFLAGVLLARYVFAQSPVTQGLFGLGASYSNIVLIGLPVILSAFGDSAALPTFLLISVHSVIMFSLMTFFAELCKAPADRDSIGAAAGKHLVKNPIILSLMAGLLFNVLSLELPAAVDDAMTLLGQAALPTALFVFGIILSQYRLAGHYRSALALVGLKMVAQPLLVWLLAFHVFHIDALWGGVAVVVAGMPTGVNTYLFAENYGTGIEPMASTIVLSTLLALGTVPFLLSWFV